MGRVILLTCEGESGCIAANFLVQHFPGLLTVIDSPVSRLGLLKRRAKRLGIGHVTGQLAFMTFQRLQRRASAQRIAAIKDEFRLDDRAISSEVADAGDVNSRDCQALLEELKPPLVFVMGTRLICQETIAAAKDAPFINYHAGITPKYRGVHGAYWALAEGDAANCGATTHLIDAGIDTGAVLYQQRITPGSQDNFSTYPYLQLAAGLPLMVRAGIDALEGRLNPLRIDLPSKLWSHPTFAEYFARGVRRGVW